MGNNIAAKEGGARVGSVTGIFGSRAARSWVAFALVTGLSLTVAALAVPTSAWAEETAKKTSKNANKRPGKVISIEEQKIEGRIQKPEAMLQFTRTPLRDDETLKRPAEFSSKIVESLEDDSM